MLIHTKERPGRDVSPGELRSAIVSPYLLNPVPRLPAMRLHFCLNLPERSLFGPKLVDRGIFYRRPHLDLVLARLNMDGVSQDGVQNKRFVPGSLRPPGRLPRSPVGGRSGGEAVHGALFNDFPDVSHERGQVPEAGKQPLKHPLDFRILHLDMDRGSRHNSLDFHAGL